MADIANLVGQLRTVTAGQAVERVYTASRLNAIQDLLKALVRGDNIATGPEMLRSVTSGGVVLRPNVRRARGSGGSGGSGGPYPFDVSIVADSTPGDIVATVRPGTINGLIASNYADTYTFSDAVTRFLVLTATSTDGEITGATLSMGSAAPDALPVLMGAPPASFDYLLGVIVNGVWYRTVGTGSLFMTGEEVFRTDKVTPTPGTLPYDIWYSWALVTA